MASVYDQDTRAHLQMFVYSIYTYRVPGSNKMLHQPFCSAMRIIEEYLILVKVHIDFNLMSFYCQQCFYFLL